MRNGEHYTNKYRLLYMRIAEAHAQESTSGKLKVGAVIVLNDLAMFGGFNGRPTGSETARCEDFNGKSFPDVIHAEVNAMERCQKSMETFYTDDSTIFITHSPCDKGCAEKLIDFGIKRVYYKHPYKCTKGITRLMEAGVTVIKL